MAVINGKEVLFKYSRGKRLKQTKSKYFRRQDLKFSKELTEVSNTLDYEESVENSRNLIQNYEQEYSARSEKIRPVFGYPKIGEPSSERI